MPRLILSPVDKEIGRRCWRARRDKGISQAQLGQMLGGLTMDAVRLCEQGKSKISISRLLEISRILEVPLAYFFEGFRDETGSVLPPVSPEAIGIARAIDMTTNAVQRKKLLDLVGIFTSATPAAIRAA